MTLFRLSALEKKHKKGIKKNLCRSSNMKKKISILSHVSTTKKKKTRCPIRIMPHISIKPPSRNRRNTSDPRARLQFIPTNFPMSFQTPIWKNRVRSCLAVCKGCSARLGFISDCDGVKVGVVSKQEKITFSNSISSH